MASRVDFAVSATPVHTHTTGEGQANTDSIAADVGKSLGGSGSIAHTWGSTVGYGSGNATLVAAGTNYAVGQTADTRSIGYEFIMSNMSRYIDEELYQGNIDWEFSLEFCSLTNIAPCLTIFVGGCDPRGESNASLRNCGSRAP